MIGLDKVYELIKSRQDKQNYWLTDSIVYLVDSGSRSYGTNTPMSDTDYKGIVIPPKKYVYGLSRFKSVHIETGAMDTKNTKDDIDITLYSLHEFVKMSLNSNPNLIEMLYVEEENIHIDYKPLRDHRDLFLTDRLRKSYGGFGIQMIRKVEKKLEQGVYDGKELLHAYRVLESGIEALTTGTLHTKRPNAEELLQLRYREVDEVTPELKEEVISGMDELYKRYKQAEEKSVLPSKPNIEKVEKLLMKLTEEYHGLV